jgi:hypothetical protein
MAILLGASLSGLAQLSHAVAKWEGVDNLCQRRWPPLRQETAPTIRTRLLSTLHFHVFHYVTLGAAKAYHLCLFGRP